MIYEDMKTLFLIHDNKNVNTFELWRMGMLFHRVDVLSSKRVQKYIWKVNLIVRLKNGFKLDFENIIGLN